MNYKIELDHEKKIVKYKHSGHINKDDIGMAWQEFLSLEEFTQKKYNLMSDYSEAKFNITDEEVTEIIGFLNNIKPILLGKKQALIIHEPISTALSLLFSSEVNIRVGFRVEVFSTNQAALRFLMV